MRIRVHLSLIKNAFASILLLFIVQTGSANFYTIMYLFRNLILGRQNRIGDYLSGSISHICIISRIIQFDWSDKMIPIENGIKVMKLIIAIIRDEASEVALESLINYEFRATRIASTGGFLRRGLTTLMIGVEDEKVEHALNIIKEKCAPLSLTNQRTATVFVLDVGQFLQI